MGRQGGVVCCIEPDNSSDCLDCTLAGCLPHWVQSRTRGTIFSRTLVNPTTEYGDIKPLKIALWKSAHKYRSCRALGDEQVCNIWGLPVCPCRPAEHLPGSIYLLMTTNPGFLVLEGNACSPDCAVHLNQTLEQLRNANAQQEVRGFCIE